MSTVCFIESNRKEKVGRGERIYWDVYLLS